MKGVPTVAGETTFRVGQRTAAFKQEMAAKLAPKQELGWRPASIPQREALESEADLLLFGGSVGGLKTETLLVDATVDHENPNYHAIIFRASYPELRDIVLKSRKLYAPMGAKFTDGSPKRWTFPSGAIIEFGYLSRDDDVYAHQGQDYGFIGFDEAGHQNEFRIRYMLTRLRSTDPTIKLRMRLTANPGGPGHSFLFKMFLRGECPHCTPDRSAVPGKLYEDAAWPSDKQPLTVTLDSGRVIKRTVSFIPSKITDHNLLGEDYVANLKTQSAATASILLSGCWKQWEGQYFDCFQETRGFESIDGKLQLVDPEMRMVVPYEELEIRPWYQHFVGGDYGFTISKAAAVICARTPPTQRWKNGRVYVIGEYVEPGVTARDYAEEMLRAWYLDADGRVPEKPRNIQMWAVSPDAYRKDGSVNDVNVPFSRLEQMNAVLAPYGFEMVMANNDRAGGWMYLYQMLRDGELVICSHCAQTRSALLSRVRDPKKFDDILKIGGDPLDDLCLAPGTLILTQRGNIPIETVRDTDLVQTRQGWQKVLSAGMTSAAASVLRMNTSDGNCLVGTSNHPVYVVGKDFVPMMNLCAGDVLQGPNGPGAAVTHLVQIGSRVPVYNLEVEEAHEYYANDLLTHNCDALRYACMTWRTKAVKPREERLAEVVQNLDPTSAMIAVQRFNSMEKKANAPVTLGRGKMRPGMRPGW